MTTTTITATMTTLDEVTTHPIVETHVDVHGLPVVAVPLVEVLPIVTAISQNEKDVFWGGLEKRIADEEAAHREKARLFRERVERCKAQNEADAKESLLIETILGTIVIGTKKPTEKPTEAPASPAEKAVADYGELMRVAWLRRQQPDTPFLDAGTMEWARANAFDEPAEMLDAGWCCVTERIPGATHPEDDVLSLYWSVKDRAKWTRGTNGVSDLLEEFAFIITNVIMKVYGDDAELTAEDIYGDYYGRDMLCFCHGRTRICPCAITMMLVDNWPAMLETLATPLRCLQNDPRDLLYKFLRLATDARSE